MITIKNNLNYYGEDINERWCLDFVFVCFVLLVMFQQQKSVKRKQETSVSKMNKNNNKKNNKKRLEYK